MRAVQDCSRSDVIDCYQCRAPPSVAMQALFSVFESRVLGASRGWGGGNSKGARWQRFRNAPANASRGLLGQCGESPRRALARATSAAGSARFSLADGYREPSCCGIPAWSPPANPMIDLEGAVQVTRSYDTLLSKGEDRRQQIVAAAQRMLTRNGWRGTTIAQIAQEVGGSPPPACCTTSPPRSNCCTPCSTHVMRTTTSEPTGREISPRRSGRPRAESNSHRVWWGTFVVMLVENLMPDAPLHGRLLDRWRLSVEIVAESIRSQQRSGRYRKDVDASVRAVEIVAFINGMEISWLLDRSISLGDVFAEYSRSLERDLAAVGGVK